MTPTQALAAVWRSFGGYYGGPDRARDPFDHVAEVTIARLRERGFEIVPTDLAEFA